MQEELPPYDDQSSPLPRYIAAGGLTSPIDTVSLLSGASQAGEYNYKSDHLHINLGPRRWGAKFPVYGFQDVIQGTVEVAKKCSHVVSVTATLKGKAAITTSQGGSVAAASDEVILSQSVKLFEAVNSDSSGGDGSKPSATLAGECFDFALSFPTYITSGRDPLPPSQALFQQGTYCSINYTVRIDIVRKGLRRHERVTIPIMYLPRSTPPRQVQFDLIQDSLISYGNEEEQFITIDLHSSNTARAALEKLQMLAQLTLPSPKIYTSGDSIPLILTLSCSKLPSLPQLLVKADSLDIHLIRTSKITSGSGGSLQEALVSRADLQRTDNSAEGVSRSHWVLQLGKTQRHVSWRVDGLAEVKNFVRVVFKPPPCSVIKQLPAFQHDEVIKLTSDPWLDPVMAEELRHLPSLGLAPLGLTAADRFTPQNPRSSLSSGPSTRL